MSANPTETDNVFGAPPPKLIQLDLDGTLVDSVPDIAWCIDRTMPRFGIPPRGESLVREWVGNGVERLVERALAGDSNTPADRAVVGEACKAFIALYSDHGCDRSRVYPGVMDGVEALRARGTRLACITNKPYDLAVELLADIELLDSFDLVIGGDTVPRRKPDPLPLLHACSELDVAVEHTLFTGDSEIDVQAARAAGIRVVCVSYGYNRGRDISEAAPDAVIDSLEQLAVLCFDTPVSTAEVQRCLGGV